MTDEELKAIGCTPIDDLITEDFGEIGTPERDTFERSCDAFVSEIDMLCQIMPSA